MHLKRKEKLDITVVMPCLNEVRTVGICVDEAKRFMEQKGLKGEVIVVDNGSSDGSDEEAKRHGAIVVYETRKGYGSAIRKGLRYVSGRVAVIGDADTTYDFYHLEGFYRPIAEGNCDMVIGNRFVRTMEKGAMPLSHRLGVRFLSACGRLAFHTDVYDFHCGLRSISREALETSVYGTIGMEFATEMIANASKNGLKVKQIPTTLSVCRQKRRSKLRAIRDGMRHLGYIVHNRG